MYTALCCSQDPTRTLLNRDREESQGKYSILKQLHLSKTNPQTEMQQVEPREPLGWCYCNMPQGANSWIPHLKQSMSTHKYSHNFKIGLFKTARLTCKGHAPSHIRQEARVAGHHALTACTNMSEPERSGDAPDPVFLHLVQQQILVSTTAWLTRRVLGLASDILTLDMRQCLVSRLSSCYRGGMASTAEAEAISRNAAVMDRE